MIHYCEAVYTVHRKLFTGSVRSFCGIVQGIYASCVIRERYEHVVLSGKNVVDVLSIHAVTDLDLEISSYEISLEGVAEAVFINVRNIVLTPAVLLGA